MLKDISVTLIDIYFQCKTISCLSHFAHQGPNSLKMKTYHSRVKQRFSCINSFYHAISLFIRQKETEKDNKVDNVWETKGTKSSARVTSPSLVARRTWKATEY